MKISKIVKSVWINLLAEILINIQGGMVNDENWHEDNGDDGDEAIKNIPERATFDKEWSKHSLFS